MNIFFLFIKPCYDNNNTLSEHCHKEKAPIITWCYHYQELFQLVSMFWRTGQKVHVIWNGWANPEKNGKFHQPDVLHRTIVTLETSHTISVGEYLNVQHLSQNKTWRNPSKTITSRRTLFIFLLWTCRALSWVWSLGWSCSNRWTDTIHNEII